MYIYAVISFLKHALFNLTDFSPQRPDRGHQVPRRGAQDDREDVPQAGECSACRKVRISAR